MPASPLICEQDGTVRVFHAPRLQQAVTLIGIVLPFFGLIAAIYSLWGYGFSWVELSLLVGMFLATGLGVTVGFHRLFVHRAFQTVRPVKCVLAVLGSMSVQGPLLRWAAIHRQHHQHSDETDDPHSPNCFGGGVWGVLRGWWHAHIGWMFLPGSPDLARYVRDLHADRLLRAISRTFTLWAALGFIIPAGLGALLSGTWPGGLLGFLWGGLARTFLIHHTTWSINSVCHLWGRQPFRGNDYSRNNVIFGILALGEGWHNNHHAFPHSARHGLRWWEFDLSYQVIRLMELVGLAWGVRVPSPQAMAAKRA